MEMFLKFDVFTVNSFFHYESNKKVASLPGLFFSIIIYIFLLYTLIKSDMVQKTNPKTSDIIKGNTLNGLNFELSSKDFRMMIKDEFNNLPNIIDYQYFDPQIWTLEIVYWDSPDSVVPLSIVNCTFSKGSLCLNDSSKINFNQKASIGIYLRICVNSSNSDIVCKPTEEIYNFVGGVKFFLHFNETLFDLNNYDNAIEDNDSIFVYAILNPNFWEYYSLNILPIEFAESKNVFLEEEVSQIYYQQDYKGSTSGFYQRKGNNDSDGYLLGIQIALSPNKRVISRKYQGLVEILGQLGGLLSILRMFGSLFLSIFPYLKIKKNFFNKLYSIPEKKTSYNESFKPETKISKILKLFPLILIN